MIKIDNIITYYPSFERGGITKNLENFLNKLTSDLIFLTLKIVVNISSI